MWPAEVLNTLGRGTTDGQTIPWTLATRPVQNTRGKGRKRRSPRAQLTHAIPLIRLEFSEDLERGCCNSSSSLSFLPLGPLAETFHFIVFFKRSCLRSYLHSSVHLILFMYALIIVQIFLFYLFLVFFVCFNSPVFPTFVPLL